MDPNLPPQTQPATAPVAQNNPPEPVTPAIDPANPTPVTLTPQNPSRATSSPDQPHPHRSGLHLRQIILLVILFPIFLGGIAFAFRNSLPPNSRHLNPTPPTPPSSPQAEVFQVSPPTPPPPTRSPETFTLGSLTFDVKPLNTPPPIFTQAPDLTQSSFTQVAADSNGNTLINARISSSDSMSGYTLFRLLRTPANRYLVVLPPDSNPYQVEEVDKFFLPEVGLTLLELPQLTPPNTINLAGQTYRLTFYQASSFDDLKSPQLLHQTDSGWLYRIDARVNPATPIFSRQVVLKLPDSTYADYYYQDPAVSDAHTPVITYANPDAFTGTRFEKPMYSAGIMTGASLIVKSDQVASLPKRSIGQTSTGQPVFEFTTENEIVQSLYRDLYLETTSQPITLGEFLASHSHIIWEDQLGDYQLYVNGQYAPAVEMAKPVIYLYPASPQTVTVQVAADVTASDPAYPQAGWTVTAHPTGRLEYQNQAYPYLFWEGMGHGPYPNTLGLGAVVTQPNLLSTLTQHLTQLGLNQKEQADFLEFWLPKLPPDPYVRLTWLLTADLDRLAPLTVTPKPQTTIRIFLEFEGLDQPAALTPQNLSHPPRTGFTLIEWGGLLTRPRSSSPQRPTD